VAECSDRRMKNKTNFTVIEQSDYVRQE